MTSIQLTAFKKTLNLTDLIFPNTFHINISANFTENIFTKLYSQHHTQHAQHHKYPEKTF